MFAEILDDCCRLLGDVGLPPRASNITILLSVLEACSRNNLYEPTNSGAEGQK